MTPQDALIELLGRVGASQDAAVHISDHELSQWPDSAVAAMKTQRLLTKARRATSTPCPGCERDCMMPVHVIPAEDNWPARAIISCYERNDIGHVPVNFSKLEQWQTTGELIAAALAKLLGFSQPSVPVAEGRPWHIGTFKGRRHNGQVTLVADSNSLALALGGHTIPLVDVLTFEKNSLALDKAALIRMVDNPTSKSETETPEARKSRLIARVNQERAKGTRAFLQVVADEEGIHKSRLQQIISEKQKSTSSTVSSNIWAGLQQKPSSSKKPKTQY